MANWSLVLCLMILFLYEGVYAGNAFSKKRPPPALGRLPPRRSRSPPAAGHHRNGSALTNVWCVARGDVPNDTLEAFRQSMCKKSAFKQECRSKLEPGRPCYFDNNRRRQASYVLNLYFVKKHTCMATYGTLVEADPSDANCHFLLIRLND
ncbi:hypothetical protein Salat_1525500 [Sesamum alatum]|uniref:X8 domain-containing protein n=1 Tax=Sesamum alatum TaxID=300844 RepID=A0AAE2CME9_9LAMI|nr:hypothetical protein Salat_1525500 [Sesamum alatum]